MNFKNIIFLLLLSFLVKSKINIIYKDESFTVKKKYSKQTKLIQSDFNRSNFNETSEALFLTSGFIYRSAEEAEPLFYFKKSIGISEIEKNFFKKNQFFVTSLKEKKIYVFEVFKSNN